MNLASKLRLCLWFARHDLLDERARWSTFVSAGTVALVSALALFAGGLVLGREKTRDADARKSPLGSALWVGTPGAREVTDANLAEAAEALRKAYGDDAAIGAFANTEVVLEFKVNAPGPDAFLPLVVGRTIAAGDNVLAGFDVTWRAKPFRGDDSDEGLVVSQSLLHRLNLDSPPNELVVRNGRGRAMSVPLRGVCKLDPPFGFSFLLPEKWAFSAIDSADDSGSGRFVVRSGPVPKEWRSADAAAVRWPPELQEVFRNWEVRVSLDGDVLLLESEDKRKTVEEWRGRLGQIRKVMEKHLHIAAPASFAEVRSEQGEAAAKLRPDRFDQGAVYVSPRVDMRSAAAVVDRVLRVHKDEMAAMEAIRADTQRDLWIIFGVGALLALLALANMVVLQLLVFERKHAEIGMLKAMGYSDLLLDAIFLIETLATTAVGILGGAFFSWIAGRGVVFLLSEYTPGIGLGAFEFPAWLVSAVAGPLLSTAVASVYVFCVRPIRSKPPCVAMTG